MPIKHFILTSPVLLTVIWAFNFLCSYLTLIIPIGMLHYAQFSLQVYVLSRVKEM